MTVERIYIGGLDPPRLTGSEIVERLKALDIDLTTLTGVDKNKPYVHIAAVSKNSDSSALEIISKNYNNVKWKGCRLSVKAAKPHFLERLEEERRQQQAEKQQQEQVETISHDKKEEDQEEKLEPSPKDAALRIPRRLRVRKKFGDEAYHVDTKPWSVDGWKYFNKALGKFRERAGKHAKSKLEDKKKSQASTSAPIVRGPLMHRAVHIRFDTDNVVNKNGGFDYDKVANDSGDSQSEDINSNSSSSDNDSLALSSSEDEANEKQDATKTKQSYAWSDDDASDDNYSPSGASADADKRLPGVATKYSKHSEESDQGIQAADGEKAKGGAPETENKYQWSSGDDSSGDDELAPQISGRPFKAVTTADEFSAGLDLGNDKSDSGSDDDENDREMGYDDHRAVYQTGGSDLTNDVRANLDVLSSLFPSMTETKPAILRSDDSGEDDSRAEMKNVKTKSAYGALGMMPRYDPNHESAQKYEVEEEKEAKNQSRGSTSENLDGGSGDSKGDNNTDASRSDSSDDDDASALNDNSKKEDDAPQSVDSTRTKDATDIYEEGKLEDVFREARNAWQVKTQEPVANEPGTSASGRGFSFGFDLGEPTKKNGPPKDDNNTGFSFSFDFPGQEIENNSKMAVQNSDEPSEDVYEENADTSKGQSESARRRGFRIPKDALEKYQSGFFACNEGSRIMEDLEGFKYNEQVKEQWKLERQTLTLDWKRKRKHAQSRIQKRMKIR